MRTVLGIDLGTQSLKVLFYDPDLRRTVAVASHPLELDQDASGKAEQDPAAWLEALAAALGSVPAEIRASVQAIGVSGQQHGLVALDADGRPLRAAKLWCDTSTQAEVDQITAGVGGRERMIELAGNAMVTGFTAPKIRWLKNHETSRYERLRHVLLPHDYVNYSLTGRMTMEHGDASGTGLMNVRARTWSPELLAAVDADRDLAICLPPVVSAGEIVGQTTPSAADRFGLPAGIPVAVGGGDNMMGAIGTGNVEPGRMTMSLGTSGTLYAFSDRPVVDPKGSIAAFCSSTGGWLPLLCTMNCTFATELVRKPLDVAVDEIDSLIGRIECGSDGLLALPFFNGERTPDLPHAKGCLIGLDAANTTRGHILRATVEGATFGLKFGIDELASLGIEAAEIVLTGGGANSRVWQQIVADVTNRPVILLAHNEGAVFGAALQALWTLERQSDPARDVGAVVADHIAPDESQGARPDPGRVARYESVYQQYRRAVEQLMPLYRH